MTCLATGGCERTVLARGLCRSHYYARPHERLPSRRKNSPRPCFAAGCTTEAVARGLCSRHYYARPDERAKGRVHARRHRDRNPDTVTAAIARLKERAARDPEWIAMVRRQANARRRALERGVRVEPRISFRAIIAEHGMTCHLCGCSIAVGELEFDHVIPLAVGGPHSRDNLRPSHGGCNRAKGAQIL